MIEIEGRRVTIATRIQTAVFEDGRLVCLESAGGRKLLLDSKDQPGCALKLVYMNGDVRDLIGQQGGQIDVVRRNDTCVDIIFSGWNGDGVLKIRENPSDGSIMIEPSAYSLRPGVVACRWEIGGIDPSKELIAPVYQGIRLKLNDPLILDRHLPWPYQWEAGFAVVQMEECGFWIHAKDTQHRYKSLNIGTNESGASLSFDTESYGPVDNCLGAGGLVWHLKVYENDWQTPVGEYRDWLWQTADLHKRQASRAAWINDIRLAVNWCMADSDLLDALAEKVPPAKTLLHLSGWRTDPYDENYPTYKPSPEAIAFVEKGKAMGFHILPHTNAHDVDPTHPVFARLRDFAYRDLRTGALQGWAWDNGSVDLPASPASLMSNRDKKVMVKIHPGLTQWRTLLTDSVAVALTDLRLPSVFIDVTLCSWNLQNCLVENMTPIEGMLRLIDSVGELSIPETDAPIVVAGEGLNETIAPGLSFAMTHLFYSSQHSTQGLERCGGTGVNAFLFKGLCRQIGYGGQCGRTDEERLRMRTHLSLGTIPTIDAMSADLIRKSNAGLDEMFDLANSK